MSHIRIKSVSVENYRSFGKMQTIYFPDQNHKKPVAIVGYNNSGKTNFLNAILYGIKEKMLIRIHSQLMTFTIVITLIVLLLKLKLKVA